MIQEMRMREMKSGENKKEFLAFRKASSLMGVLHTHGGRRGGQSASALEGIPEKPECIPKRSSYVALVIWSLSC